MNIDEFAPGTPSFADLGTPDIPGAIAFYGSLFGWTAEDQGPDAQGYHLFRLSDRVVAGLGPQMNTDAPPYWSTYITVADADAAASAITAAGGTVVVPPMDVLDAGRMAVAIDPVGAAFQIWQPLGSIGSEVVNEPGSLIWNELTTRDTDTATAFYGSVFGWTARQSEGPMPYTEFHLGDNVIGGMMQMDDNWPSDLPSHWMVYFAVEDTDATAAAATELGGSVCVPPTDIPVGRFSVLADASGATFSVIAMADQPADT